MSRKTLTTLAVLVVAAAAANSAFAGGCGGGGGRGRKYYGGSNLHHRYISSHNHGVYKHHHRKVVVHKPVIVQKHVVDHCHHPKFCLAYVCPGDTLLSICAREYGNANFWSRVAAFNHIPAGAPLAVGQPIKLPTIYDSGRMIASDSPAPPAPAVVRQVGVSAGPAPQPGIAGGFAPQQLPQGQPGLPPQQLQQGPPQQQVMPQGQLPQQQAQQQPIQQQQFQQPPQQQDSQQLQVQPISSGSQVNIRQAERTMPTFTAGSQLVLDGQQFGGTPGQVQLVVGPMTLPVTVANWTPGEVTIQLPELPLTKAADARVVILDADGKLVTQSEIRLAPASSRLAMDN